MPSELLVLSIGDEMPGFTLDACRLRGVGAEQR